MDEGLKILIEAFGESFTDKLFESFKKNYAPEMILRTENNMFSVCEETHNTLEWMDAGYGGIYSTESRHGGKYYSFHKSSKSQYEDFGLYINVHGNVSDGLVIGLVNLSKKISPNYPVFINRVHLFWL